MPMTPSIKASRARRKRADLIFMLQLTAVVLLAVALPALVAVFVARQFAEPGSGWILDCALAAGIFIGMPLAARCIDWIGKS